MSWTRFFDMSSGGTEKTNWEIIYIELPVSTAINFFEQRFGINPNNITCFCCGHDFSIEEVDLPPLNPDETELIIGIDEIKPSSTGDKNQLTK